MTTILIADDAAFMWSTLKFIVENGGHKVIGMANEGIDVVRLYKDLKPDIVCFKLGASGFIRKPFNNDEIIAEIQKILKKP